MKYLGFVSFMAVFGGERLQKCPFWVRFWPLTASTTSGAQSPDFLPLIKYQNHGDIEAFTIDSPVGGLVSSPKSYPFAFDPKLRLVTGLKPVQKLIPGKSF